MARGVFTLELSGVGHMISTLRTQERRARDAIRDALQEEARNIMAESMVKYVPVFMGDLRASGRVSQVEKKGDTYEVTLSYGSGSSKRYALAVHEHPSPHSPRSWKGKGVGDIRATRSRTPWTIAQGGGRGPKYLERPMKKAVSSGKLMERIKSRVEKAVRRGR